MAGTELLHLGLVAVMPRHGYEFDQVSNKPNWRMIIVYEPDWLTVRMFDDAVAAAAERLSGWASRRRACAWKPISKD